MIDDSDDKRHAEPLPVKSAAPNPAKQPFATQTDRPGASADAASSVPMDADTSVEAAGSETDVSQTSSTSADAPAKMNPPKQSGDEFSWTDILADGSVDPTLPTFDEPFGIVPIEKFASEILDVAQVPGIYIIEFEATALQCLVDFTKLSAANGESDSGFSWLELTIKRRLMRGRTYDRASFSVRVIAPLNVSANFDEDKCLVCIVSHRVLSRAMRAAQATVVLTYDSSNERLTFRSGRFTRPLLLKAAEKFMPPDARALGAELETPPRTVATADIQRALDFASPFAPTGDVHAALRSIEVTDGRVMAGSTSNIAQLASPTFKDWNFRLDQAHAARMLSALPDLGESVKQTETEHYTQFATSNAIFGVARPGTPFPKLDLQLPSEEPLELAADRKQLHRRLLGLRSAESSEFTFRVRNNQKSGVRAVLSVPLRQDRSAVTSIVPQWRSADNKPFSVKLPLDIVIASLAAHHAMWIYLSFYMNEGQLIIHNGERDKPEVFAATRIGLLGRRRSKTKAAGIFSAGHAS